MLAAPIAAIHGRGLVLAGTATTVDDRARTHAGIDGIVAQGARRVGIAGPSTAQADASLIGTLALVPQIVDAVRLPVIGGGGIMDGRGIAAVLILGAGAAQLGTSCDEAGDARGVQQASAREDQTAHPAAFSGRRAPRS